MKIAEDVRRCAAEQALTEDAALQNGMQETATGVCNGRRRSVYEGLMRMFVYTTPTGAVGEKAVKFAKSDEVFQKT